MITNITLGVSDYKYSIVYTQKPYSTPKPYSEGFRPLHFARDQGRVKAYGPSLSCFESTTASNPPGTY